MYMYMYLYTHLYTCICIHVLMKMYIHKYACTYIYPQETCCTRIDPNIVINCKQNSSKSIYIRHVLLGCFKWGCCADSATGEGVLSIARHALPGCTSCSEQGSLAAPKQCEFQSSAASAGFTLRKGKQHGRVHNEFQWQDEGQQTTEKGSFKFKQGADTCAKAGRRICRHLNLSEKKSRAIQDW